MHLYTLLLGLDCFLHLVCHFVCVRGLLKHCLGTKWAGSTPNGRDEVWDGGDLVPSLTTQ